MQDSIISESTPSRNSE